MVHNFKNKFILDNDFRLRRAVFLTSKSTITLTDINSKNVFGRPIIFDHSSTVIAVLKRVRLKLKKVVMKYYLLVSLN